MGGYNRDAYHELWGFVASSVDSCSLRDELYHILRNCCCGSNDYVLFTELLVSNVIPEIFQSLLIEPLSTALPQHQVKLLSSPFGYTGPFQLITTAREES